MKKLSFDDLNAIIGKKAATSLLAQFPVLLAQQDPDGDRLEGVMLRLQEPWSGERLDVQVQGAWVTLTVPAGVIRHQVISAMAQARMEGRQLGVQVKDGELQQIWVI